MPLQIIINTSSPQEAMTLMAEFLGMRGLQGHPADETLKQTGNGSGLPIGAGTAGSGAGEAGTTEAPPKKRAGRPKKEAAAEPEQQTATDVAAQDDADEVQDMTDTATVDDVRAALNDIYVKRYGMEATQKDILKLYSMRFPDGSVTKASEIPAGMHGQVIEDIKEMAQKNPFKRARVDQVS